MSRIKTKRRKLKRVIKKILCKLNPLYRTISYLFDSQIRVEKQIVQIKERLDAIQNDGRISDILHKIDAIQNNEGLKQKLQTLEEKSNYLENLIKVTTDITNVPQAKGCLRIIQKGSAKLLDLVDKICVENNIQYWMHYGTLIGALRHKGFIPWDDDIDICMMRDDYEELIRILSKGNLAYTKTKGLLTYNVGDVLKIFYKSLPIRVDIFPFDFYYKKVKTIKEYEMLSTRQQIGQDEVKFDWNNLLKGFPDEIPSNTLSYQDIRTIQKRIVMRNKAPNKNGSIYRGIETIPTDKKIYDPDFIFPIRKIEFEGYSLMAPNRSDLILYNRFGDIYKFPYDLNSKHTLLEKLNENVILEIEDFLKKNNTDLLKNI